MSPIDPNDVPTAPQLNRLHGSSVIFDALSHIRSLIFPTILLVLGVARGDSMWLVIGALTTVPTLIYSVIRYLTLRFFIDNGQLVIKQGLIFRNVRSVPVERIQNIDFVQNPLHRLIGVAEVRVETAAGSNPEATLRVLTIQQIEQLRGELFRSRQQPVCELEIPASTTSDASLDEATSTTTHERVLPEGESTILLEIPAMWLFWAGLASNRGVLMIGVLLAFVFESDAFRKLDLQRVRDFLPHNLGVIVSIGMTMLGFLMLMLLLRIFGVIWYQLRFHGYRLSRKGEDLRISCGMFTKVQATIPRRRIQFISVQSNLIMRFLGFSAVRIETASSSGNHEDATKSVSSRWFIPIVTNDQLAVVLNQIRPGLLWDERLFNLQPVSSRATKRIILLVMLAAFALSAIGLLYSRPWGLLVGVAIFPPLFWLTRRRVQSMCYGRTSDGVVFRSGIFTTKTSMTFFEKIQSLRVQQSPFDRRWHMAKLSLDTAAAGPADHVIRIPLLDQAVAFQEQESIKQLAASHQPIFG